MRKRALTKRRTRLSWAFLRGFCVKPRRASREWACIDAMRAAAPVGASLRRYEGLLHRWNRRLHDLCGDPSSVAWTAFRPLRLSREEDWSDWLAWLFETSAEGELAWNLFGGDVGRPARCFRNPEVRREDPSEDQARRGDIVLLWKHRLGIHIEVKVGDEQFEKTLETGRKLRAKYSVREWRNIVLIPEESAGAWDDGAERDGPGGGQVEVLLWNDVARGVRNCLWSRHEPAVWRMWAWTFCGAVEEKLLGLTPPQKGRSGFREFDLAIRWMELLGIQKGMKNEH